MTRARRVPSARHRRTKGFKPPTGIAMRYAAMLRGYLASLQALVDLSGWHQNPVPFSGRLRTDASRFVHKTIGPLRVAVEERLSPKKLGENVGIFAERVNAHNVKEFTRVIGIPTSSVLVGDQALLMHAFRDTNVNLIESLVGNQLDELTAILEEAEIGAWRVEELSEKIQASFGVSESKADLIARDQTLKLNGQLTETRQTSVGITHYIWTTSNDERVRPDHAELDGQTFPWDDPPVTNDDGDTNNPGGDYQCRCTAFPVLDELTEAGINPAEDFGLVPNVLDE